MRLHILLDNVNIDTDDDSLAVTVQNYGNLEYGIVQTSGTGTFTLYGRTSPNMPWVQVDQYTNSFSDRVTLFPHMYMAASGVVGTVRAELLS